MVLAATAVLWSGADTVSAQTLADRSEPNRFWVGVALGGAGGRLACDLCDPARELGPTAELAVGSYATPELRVGVEAGGWTHDDNGSRENAFRLGIVSYLQTSPESKLVLVGGFGWARYMAGEFRYDAPRVGVGVGWEQPMGNSLRVGTTLMLDSASWGRLRSDETVVARNVGLSLVRLAVNVYAP